MKHLKMVLLFFILSIFSVGCAVTAEPSTPSSISSSTPNPTFTKLPTQPVVPASPTSLPTNTPYPTSLPQPSTITVCGSGCDFRTVQEAINDSGTQDGDIIGILDEVHTEAGILVSKSVTIQGLGLDKTIVQAHEQTGQATQRVFTITENVKVTLRNLTIQKGYPSQAPFSGGGIRNQGDLTIENCLIRNNSAGDGGGILNRGNLLVINSTISHNFADGIGEPGIECGTGGGINNAFGYSLIIHNSQIKNNIAAGKGGGLHIACEGNANIINTEISENKSTKNGGGIFLKGTLILIDSLITRNSTPADGGGIIIYGTLHYIDTVIGGNLAGGNCIIWGDDSYKGQGEVGVENNTRVPDNNCHLK